MMYTADVKRTSALSSIPLILDFRQQTSYHENKQYRYYAKLSNCVIIAKTSIPVQARHSMHPVKNRGGCKFMIVFIPVTDLVIVMQINYYYYYYYYYFYFYT